jgi:glutathione S-transferase
MTAGRTARARSSGEAETPVPVKRKAVGRKRTAGETAADPAVTTRLTISSKNYSSWSLRGWLMVRFAGLPFIEERVDIDAPGARAELLLLAPSILVPCLTHRGIRVWDTLAIGEYLNEVVPEAGLLPADPLQRAHCRSICGEMHSGFTALRASLPMNLKARFTGFKVWSKAQTDIQRIEEIWQECLQTYGGPYLFGERRTLADAMFAPVATRFRTYGVALSPAAAAYRDTILALPELEAWTADALQEPEELDELDMDF